MVSESRSTLAGSQGGGGGELPLKNPGYAYVMPSSLPPLGRQKVSNGGSRTNGCIQDENTVQCGPSAFVFFSLIYPPQALLSTYSAPKYFGQRLS